MNNPTNPPPIPPVARTKTEPKLDQLNVLSLLQHPAATIGAALARNEVARLTAIFALTAVLCFAVFGLVLGTYSGGAQLWAVPVKVAGGGLFAALLCLPSLMIFGAMGGMTVTPARVVLMLSGFLALTGLLLVGFAPVVWLFGVSTESIGFMGFLAISVAAISVFIGCSAMFKMAAALGQKNVSTLVLWQAIFIFVMLQLTCTLRPLLGEYDRFLHFGEKKFFIVHWVGDK